MTIKCRAFKHEMHQVLCGIPALPGCYATLAIMVRVQSAQHTTYISYLPKARHAPQHDGASDVQSGSLGSAIQL
jgi:hypothetical protein